MANDDWHILDSRNGNRSGPYSKGDALAQAELLNRFVLRNDSPLLAALCAGGTVTGPFYARPGGVGRARPVDRWDCDECHGYPNAGHACGH